jgi:hypothetical protein
MTANKLQKTVGEIALRTTDATRGWIGEMRGKQHGVVVRALREQA